VVALASTATGRAAAERLYEDVLPPTRGTYATHVTLLGAAAVAATALGESADAERLATQIAATLTTEAGTTSDRTATWNVHDVTTWPGGSASFGNPFAGTGLPLEQLVLWGDGTTTAVGGGSPTHVYQRAGTYRPRVRLSLIGMRDAFIDLGRITVLEPQARYAAPASAWPGRAVRLDRVTLIGGPTRVTLHWGDGASTAVGLGENDMRTHTYRTPGTYRPQVLMERGSLRRWVDATGAPILVRPDVARPVVTVPRPAAPSRVASWRTVRGTATDAGSGVRRVTVHVVEKRAGRWYSYDGIGWTKRTSYTSARAKAKRSTVAVSADGAWSLSLRGLTEGRLQVRAVATDHAGNTSAVRLRDARLTRR
jgi:plastocyanin